MRKIVKNQSVGGGKFWFISWVKNTFYYKWIYSREAARFCRNPKHGLDHVRTKKVEFVENKIIATLIYGIDRRPSRRLRAVKNLNDNSWKIVDPSEVKNLIKIPVWR